jgi:hypothetical protein
MMFRIPTATLAVAVVLGTTALAQDAPEIQQKGKFVSQWKDDRVQIDLGLRFANSQFPSKWLMIQTGVAATSNKPIRIDREDITLVMPGGDTVNLASQKALTEGLPDVRHDYEKAAIIQDPIEGYFVGPTRHQRIGFFSPPAQTITYEQVTVDRETLALGYLFFHAPGDKFPPGKYVLQVYNKDVDLRLPFVLPADSHSMAKGDKPKKRNKNDKTVPW